MGKNGLRYLAIIPARGGSKGIPRKNLMKLAGKPLVTYSFEAALKSRSLDRIILSTDSPEIAALGKRHKVEVPFLRPPKLSGDKAILEDVMRHLLDWLKKEEDYVPDAVMLLHPTSPLRKARHIREAVKLFESSDVDTVVSVSPPMEHPCDMVTFKDDRMSLLYDSIGCLAGKQRQQYPVYYFVNGAIYIFKTASFYKFGSRFGRTVLPYIMRQIDSIDIDSKDDMKIAELILKDRDRQR